MQSDESLPPKKGLSLKRRIGIVSCIAWLIVVMVIALNLNTSYTYVHRSTIDGVGLFTDFSVFGIIPVVVGVGITWIASARRHRP